jgi:hypothetical protein
MNALDMIFDGERIIAKATRERLATLKVIRDIASGIETDPVGATQRHLFEIGDKVLCG